MIVPATVRAIVSGSRRGIGAALLRTIFAVIAIPYGCVVAWRNRAYDRRRKEIHNAGVPVVSVGNLTMGGTGKTPVVAWLARWFREQNARVAIVSRGYRAGEDGRNDEARELESQLRDVPHVQNPDRVAACTVATGELESQVIVLDDGFQHRRLARDLDIVLLDATQPFGYDHLFPRGMLREQTSGLARAHVVALSRADMLDESERADIRDNVRSLAPGAAWVELAHAPRALLAASGNETSLDSLRGKRIAAFCGLGNPEGFRHTLQACGFEVVLWREFPDHHAYSRTDLESLASDAKSAGAAAIVCTHKDLVKIEVDRLGDIPLWAVTIGIDIRSGEQALVEQLESVLANVSDGESTDEGALTNDEQN